MFAIQPLLCKICFLAIISSFEGTISYSKVSEDNNFKEMDSSKDNLNEQNETVNIFSRNSDQNGEDYNEVDKAVIVRGYDTNPKNVTFGFRRLQTEHKNSKSVEKEDEIGLGRGFTQVMFEKFSPGKNESYYGPVKEKVNHNAHLHTKTVWATLTGAPTFYLAHRGEKVFMPENTLPAFEFAVIMGADITETDLVLTKDGVLACYHDLVLSHGTDVASKPEFSHLQRNFTGIINKKNVTILNEWFIKDFTWEQLKTLRVLQKAKGIRPLLFSGMFRIPSFSEFLELIHREAFRLKRPVPIAPELKDPQFHNEQLGSGSANFMEDLVLQELKGKGYPLRETEDPKCKFLNKTSVPCGNVILQSFDANCLKHITTKSDLEVGLIVDTDLVEKQLDRLTYKGIEAISKFVNYYILWKEWLYTGIEAELSSLQISYDKEKINKLGGFVPPSEIVKTCHNLNMKVMVYTIYDSREASLRGCTRKCDPLDKEVELFFLFDLGVDFLFIENIPEGLELRERYNTFLGVTQTRKIFEEKAKAERKEEEMKKGVEPNDLWSLLGINLTALTNLHNYITMFR